MTVARKFKVGDWVEVCSKEEILQTLDAKGQLDGMPFMPEMFEFCGKRFQVYRRAHKTCDTVFPIRSRRVTRAVHLETRCNGSAHGGCQAGCSIFWKEAWLKPIDPTREASEKLQPKASQLVNISASSPCTEPQVWAGAETQSNDASPTYVCQTTRLPYATSDLQWWDLRQYVEDYSSGNVTITQILGGLLYSSYYRLSQSGIGLGGPMRWLYERVSWLWGRTRFPRATGIIPDGHQTPSVALNLQAGEMVRVKSHEEILSTLNISSRNRGLSWDAEMVPYCGGTYKVLKRVDKIVDEKTGKMQDMKNPCIILDSVICQARYSGCRMFCPRALYPFWREAWLKRIVTEEGGIHEAEVTRVSLDSVDRTPISNCMADSERMIAIQNK